FNDAYEFEGLAEQDANRIVVRQKAHRVNATHGSGRKTVFRKATPDLIETEFLFQLIRVDHNLGCGYGLPLFLEIERVDERGVHRLPLIGMMDVIIERPGELF